MDSEYKVKLKTLFDKAQEELEKAKPSNDLGYWAKRSCNRCYGRGIEGTMKINIGNNNTLKQEVVCDCVTRRYKRWQKEWLDNWLAERIEKDGTIKSEINNEL